MTVMKNFIKGFSVLAATAAVLFISGCADDNDKSSEEINKEYVEAWMEINHPGIEPTGQGIYILSDSAGTGEALSDEDIYAMIEYTVADLDGTITTTTSTELSQQLGTYNKSYYYGAHWFIRSEETTNIGLLDMLDGMNIGGVRTALVPSWLNETANSTSSSASNAIYTIKLVDKTDDIVQWEIDTLESYTQKYMNDVDSTFTGYYYLQIKAPTDTSTLPTDTTFYINYTGKLLNGLVFDTTVEDTAKYYGIYSSSKTYAPVEVQMSDDISSITISTSSSSSSSSVVTGFAYCLSKLKLYEKGICAFTSQYGYQYSGSGSSIPGFSPLVFEIEMVDEP
jgi:FKBP-type peptidyl-prolyl cis-trans isomerase FklB